MWCSFFVSVLYKYMNYRHMSREKPAPNPAATQNQQQPCTHPAQYTEDHAPSSAVFVTQDQAW